MVAPVCLCLSLLLLGPVDCLNIKLRVRLGTDSQSMLGLLSRLMLSRLMRQTVSDLMLLG